MHRIFQLISIYFYIFYRRLIFSLLRVLRRYMKISIVLEPGRDRFKADKIEAADFTFEKGTALPLGANLIAGGCNFSIFSANAEKVSLFLFENEDSERPIRIYHLNKKQNKTGDIWHIFISGIKHGQFYGYAIDGPFAPEAGHRFNGNKLLIDPYARAVTRSCIYGGEKNFGYIFNHPDRDLSFNNHINYGEAIKSIVIDNTLFNWGNDFHPQIPLKDSIIYEMHVRGFTQSSSSDCRNSGTYSAIAEKIPYLKKLGITAVELLPVYEFNENENMRIDPETKNKLVNFWGYSTLSFFAPETLFSIEKSGTGAVEEFKSMVKELHKAGIEVILDVVYNHTGEGNELGPTLSFRGIDNSVYYMLEKGRYYKNYSGCGNTFNCNHPAVKKFIIDSLHYWVTEMRVDGFRFDLAAILGRGTDGVWQAYNTILSEISHDPVLSKTKIIAESWDAAGLYKLGEFPGRWAEWNGKFRDDVRIFIKGNSAGPSEIAKRLCGSSDIFGGSGRKPYHSINFITCHDGFTLNDLVSYNEKHNSRNGENNNDGDNNNNSWNCGTEGNTSNKEINILRERQMKNFFTILMMSQGAPMIHSGDELMFSKNGNNNTYCQDNELNWIDWKLAEKNKEFLDFCRYMISFRKKFISLRRESFFNGSISSEKKIPEICWYDSNGNIPDWHNTLNALAFQINIFSNTCQSQQQCPAIYCAINSHWTDIAFKLPKTSLPQKWHICVDTFHDHGFFEEKKEMVIDSLQITVKSRSIIIAVEK